ncbi:hypothetical protein H112_04803 [Trichophyton rubrum D6]|uniref:Uncharacterized protein n=4 Tax=Trichophyton TaxID=5550 RepID=A0A178F3M1_TRIRU|nr:uncharacterized protein TERG_04567 [Trichophyton rubrum CBS 118892]EZF22354.1 hypothetical protein H100_04812 [Trichophyton rubrum MR850]EZF41502.1 hypothetical protein H102_04799 [Trichophyton rubrum CBS 100081]EZF52075.1 hypothetical protein H103_04803 [Trichophyton rubrum CBS 288.86]EZF62732.1 hypothetical protein H104_04790 [Trichophyton rubrum CBS 289.86]EZF73355.1 hypothetical protein H105_04820 [Trichophyton soudanense CBS 452.61]EZF83979.1 hypothetical protein H110_04799 [Trichophy
MDSSSDRPSPLASIEHLSSSLPTPQPWANQSLSTLGTRGRLFNPALDDPTLARRTTALRQLHGITRPPQRKHRQSASIASRASLSSQPVIVRTYSGGSERESTMSRRRSSDREQKTTNAPPARLPSVDEFGIEGILQSIEPNIQVTLDAIAEICGRSKLSLANEYGSHRPPLGEIRAPARTSDHGLLTVEEASPSTERLADDNVLVVGDDISTVDGHGRYSSTYDYLNPIPRPTGLFDFRNSLPQAWAETNTTQQQAESHTHTIRRELAPTHEETVPPARHHHLVDKGRLPYLPWALDTRLESGDYNATRQSMMTRPVISAVHLDAQADRSYHLTEPDRPWPSTGAIVDVPDYGELPHINGHKQKSHSRKSSVLDELQGFLSWVGKMSRAHGKPSQEVTSLVSAQEKLRDVLEKQNARLSHLPNN